jgi:hypothetical protein
MLKTYTKREMAYKLKSSVRTIEEYAKYLNLTPSQGDRYQNLYSQRDFDLIYQLREHCAANNTKESFVPNSEIEILKEDQAISVTRIEPLPTPAIEIYKESLRFGLTQDPLFDLELLQRISDRAYLLPTSRLAPILGISSKYLSRKKKYCHCGFIVSKEAIVAGKTLWKVSSNNS